MGRRIFFADFVAGFFRLIFVGKSAQKNPPGKSPAKSSEIYTTKIPDTFLQSGQANMSGTFFQARKEKHKPKLSSPDILRWDRGLPREGLGAKKFGMCLGIGEMKLFGRDIPGFCWDIPGGARTVRTKKSLCSIFGPYSFTQSVGMVTLRVAQPS